MPMMLNSLFKENGLEPFNIKLARHSPAEGKVSPFTLWRQDKNLFQIFQNIQSNKVFKVDTNIASFILTPSGKNVFAGIYAVNELTVAPPGTIDPSNGIDACGKHLYRTQKTEHLGDLVGRLCVFWSHRNFTLYANNNDIEISELLQSFEEDPFPGYFKFKCNLNEINSLPDKWKIRLREAKGVYVLTSLESKEHYVGSAAGSDGFFQRWSQHATIGGAAVGLQRHGVPDYQVSILQVASGFETKDDIVRIENEWMQKLQSRTMGLNGHPKSVLFPKDLNQN